MPDPRSIHSTFSIATQSDELPVTRYYPGRSVSVQFGLPASIPSFPSETRTRIILLLEVGDAAARDVRFSRLRHPSVVVLAAGEPDIFRALTCDRTITLFVETRFVRETASLEVKGMTVGDLVEVGRNDMLVDQLIKIFYTLCQREQRPCSLYVESLGTVMAAHVLHYFFDGEAPADRRGGLPAGVLQRIIAHIDAHFAEEFDADALARASGYSRNHFQRLFRKSLDQTPREYVRGRQVEHAITLLQTTTLKGLDVALACGFCDETQMARWFWRLRRCLPGQVRDAARR